jgi:hypothetical protein
MSNNVIPLTDPSYNEGHVQSFDRIFSGTGITGNNPTSSGAVLLPSQGFVALAGSAGTGGLYVQLPVITAGLPGASTPGNDGQKLVLLDVVGQKHAVFAASTSGLATSGTAGFVFSGTSGQKTEFNAYGGTWYQVFETGAYGTSGGTVVVK